MLQPRVIVSNIGFTEGPVWTTGGRLLVTSMSRGLVYDIDLISGAVVGEIETGGGPNGLAEDHEGRVWVAQNGGVIVSSRSTRSVAPGLQQILDGAVDDIVTTGFLAPNDLVQGPDGRIWFTDPGGPSDTGPGRVWLHDPDTGLSDVVATEIDFPNGLAFTPSGDELLVAETRTGRILRYGRNGSELRPLGVFATLPAGGPDGLAFDAEGALYAAAPEADMIAVFAPDGTPGEHIHFDAPTFPTNLCFAGSDHAVLVVTAAKGGRVLALEGRARGIGSLAAESSSALRAPRSS
jgi:gluconolactonase